MPQVRGGNIKAYRGHRQEALAGAPDMPTTDEAGLPGFYFSFWHAFWVPKGTPKDIVAKLNDAAVKALADPATRKRLIDIGQEIFPPRDVDAGGARPNSRRPRSRNGGR